MNHLCWVGVFIVVHPLILQRASLKFLLSCPALSVAHCVFFSAIKDELWLFLIPAVLGAILLGIFLEEVGFILRHVTSSRRKQLYLWILGMYPVTSTTLFTHISSSDGWTPLS